MLIKELVKDILSNQIFAAAKLPFGFANYADILPLLNCRGAAKIPENAASVIPVLFPYYINININSNSKATRNISRYAMISDYHQIAGEYLSRACEALEKIFSENKFIYFVDNSPIREVHAAHMAGLGIVGQNGLLINKIYGSYVFIGEIISDLKIIPDEFSTLSCLSCGKCLSQCPTNALKKSGAIELNKCRSNISQKKGELSPWEINELKQGKLVWGCDICNDVCPMNSSISESMIPEFKNSVVPLISEENVAELFSTRAFNYRSKNVILRNLKII